MSNTDRLEEWDAGNERHSKLAKTFMGSDALWKCKALL